MITVIKDRYISTHGKEPRGSGNWAFSDRNCNIIAFFPGTYSSAERAARKWAKLNNLSIIYTLG